MIPPAPLPETLNFLLLSYRNLQVSKCINKSIFNLDKEGKEQEKTEEDEAAQATTEAGSEKRKKILLDDEEPEKDKKYGLQQPVVKKRFIDGPTSKVEKYWL